MLRLLHLRCRAWPSAPLSPSKTAELRWKDIDRTHRGERLRGKVAVKDNEKDNFFPEKARFRKGWLKAT